MYKIIFIVTFLLIMGCSSKRIIMNIKCDNIESVLITDLVTGKKRSVNNVSQLCPLFNSYLSTAKKELFKFEAVYALSFLYEGEEWSVLVNANHIKVNGVTFVLDSNLENYIRNYLLEKAERSTN